MPEQLRPESKDLGEVATFIPNSSFEQSFHPRTRDNTSRGLPLNPEPRTITRIYYVKEHPTMPTPQIRNLEGIVLRASKGGEGGRSLSLFTREMGLIHLTLPRAVMNRCGTGILLSFACVRLSAAIYPEYGVISQYEGRLLFDMMKLSYEDMTCWYYVIELVLALYPVGQKEDEAYDILMAAARAVEERNPRVIAFIAAVKLLAAAGYDPTEAIEDPTALSEGARDLLCRFRGYRWGSPFEGSISRALFTECARYLDHFLLAACDTEMKTAGAFL